MANKKSKIQIEVLLSSIELSGIKIAPKLIKTIRLVTVDLIWPRQSVSKKTMAREVEFKRSRAEMTGESWTRRIFFREEVAGHCGLTVTVSEILDDEWIEKFLRTTARYALREFSDFIQQHTVGIGDIASSPLDALASLEGTYPGPKTALRGVLDVTEEMLPGPGKSVEIEIPLYRLKNGKKGGSVFLEVRAGT